VHDDRSHGGGVASAQRLARPTGACGPRVRRAILRLTEVMGEMADDDEPQTDGRFERRPPRVGDGRSPITTVVVLGCAAAAVIAGLVILRSVTASSGDADPAAADTAPVVVSPPSSPAPTSPPSTTSTTATTTTTTTTTVPAAKSDATIVVANASGVQGSATAMADDLEAAGYTVAPVANAPGQRIEQSIIYVVAADPKASGVARLLAQQIPTAQTLPMPAQPPLDRPLAGATVALLLGRDVAGRPLGTLTTG
jgi:hypothetical protein